MYLTNIDTFRMYPQIDTILPAFLSQILIKSTSGKYIISWLYSAVTFETS